MKDTTKIPMGDYCYDESGPCPYWSSRADLHPQENGYCSYLGYGDWQHEELSLLWDQCKECGINNP